MMHVFLDRRVFFLDTVMTLIQCVAERVQSVSKHIVHGTEPLNAVHIREKYHYIIMKHTPTEEEMV